MKIRAPAKVNLYLRVVGKRGDGYHLLDTLMVPVSLCDEIEITRPLKRTPKTAQLTVTCDDPCVPSGNRNLAFKAASLLFKKKGIKESVHIRIHKRIPVGAGLGGGSSDAAATLVALDRLLRLHCRRHELLALAASLGADVPFFVVGRPARAKGIGERIQPLSSFPKLWLVILYPGFPVSTRWVFEHLPPTLTKSIETFSMKFSVAKPGELNRLLVNDLENVTISRYPKIALLKDRLIKEGAAGALMSGSGSSVFGIFAGEQMAKKACRRLSREEEGVRVFLVRSLS
ncbi:MAG: 4-(cytidine 5'-diphospho)-2-C-methyl-D-erythritol kinase [Deltaproteobacteria bacterium]|nr:4-(cytidine 5'-diphospho)-2-C-methyl-D-erythritol kinase [Deltaproteobacteria bacterium]